MANAIFRGGAGAVAQVDKATPANVEADDTFTMTITDHLGAVASVTHTAVDDVEATVVTGLYDLAVAAKAAGEVPWTRITATDDTTHVTLTADTAGMPFTLVCAKTGTGTLTGAAVTACSGPNLLSVADNMEDGTVLAAADNLIIPADCAYDIYYEDLSGTELGSIDFEDGYTGDVGAPARPLKLDVATSGLVHLAGTGNIHIALTGATAAVQITQAGVGSGVGTYGINLTTGEANMTVDVNLDSSGGRVGLAALAGQTGTFTTVKVSEGDVTIGNGVTMTTLTTTGGVTHNQANATTINNEGGVLHREKASTVGTWNMNKGKAYEQSSGTATAVKLTGTIDVSKDLRARTWTNADLYPGAKLIDPHKTITFTNPMTLNHCGLNCVDRGVDMNVTLAAAS